MFRAYARYFKLTGRSGRSEFWLFHLWHVLAATGAFAIDEIYLGGTLASGGPPGPLLSIVSLVNFIPSLTVTIRRLHDTNRRTMWLLLELLPVIGWFLLLYWMVKRSDIGPNDYGWPDGKSPSPAVTPPAAAPVNLDRLEQLARLHGSGALTDEEFRTQKALLLK